MPSTVNSNKSKIYFTCWDKDVLGDSDRYEIISRNYNNSINVIDYKEANKQVDRISQSQDELKEYYLKMIKGRT
jgi:hypothetical protein